MGRLTQFIDLINTDELPIPRDRDSVYSHIDHNSLIPVRKKYRRELKAARKLAMVEKGGEKLLF